MKNNLLIYVAFSGANESRVNLQSFKERRAEGEGQSARAIAGDGKQ
jgi:hypothetical protein